MAKLNVKVDLNFVTDGFLKHNEDTFREELLNADEVVQYVTPDVLNDLSLHVVTQNPEDEFDSIGFELPLQNSSSLSCTIELNDDNTGITAEIKGDISINLRAGVIDEIQSNWPLKIQGISYKGGSYNGFMSNLGNQDPDDYATWQDIVEFSFK